MNILKNTKPTALRSRVLIILCLLMAMSLAGCEPVTKSPTNETANKTAESREPTIEASPIAKTDDQWQVISADNITLKVNADDARSVRILYRPAFAEDRHVELKKIASPSDKGVFSTQFKVPSDFAGDVWAEVQYANGTKKETKPISLTVETISSSELADASYKHTEESARSDRITGGTIEKATFQPGQPDIRITVNVPAFQLTLWQGGKEVKTYPIGIGRKEFPLPDGLRRATQIVFNPEWVPPDSSWIEDHDVVPGERVEADDPRNPLGKIKIPLGNGILIHQASRPSDLGHLVSHGCVRLLLSDLFDLCEKIIAARSLPVTKQQIDHAKNSKDRLGVKLDAPIIVDISYDTQVVEGGVLHLYPDVYDHNTDTVEKVREEVQSAGVDLAKLDDSLLRQMLERVKPTEEFVVSLADIKGANAMASGKNQSLTGQPIKTPPSTARKRTAKGR